MAQGVLRHKIDERGLSADIEVQSSGTGAWHLGEPPDPRARRAAAERGVTLENRAERFKPADFERYDLILTMDEDNFGTVRALASSETERSKVRMFRDYDPEGRGEVPDPYFGGEGGFARVLDMIERTSEALLDEIQREIT